MVKITVAGGSGAVAREVIDALTTSKKHDITVLSRNDSQTSVHIAGVSRRAVDYGDKAALVEALWGTHTLLSFVQILSDPDQQSQKNLIDAAIVAGVKRFAPSEYGSSGTMNMPWWAPKENIRKYLEKVNEKEKTLEYTLFQPGLFLDYLASPYQTAQYVTPLDSIFDYQNRRALVVDGHEDAIMTLTTAGDLAEIVARAVEYEGEWPKTGGIRGNRVTFSQILEVGERVRGRPFTIEKVKIEDLEAGNLKTSWALGERHHAVPEDQAAKLAKTVSVGILLSSTKGAWAVSDAFNQIFPDYKFADMEAFLAKVWAGKP